MRVAPLDAIIFTAGLAAAAASGIWTYDRYGMYGDGPRGPGHSREWDPVSRSYRRVHEAETSDGRVRRTFNDRGSVVEVEVDRDLDGIAEQSIRIAPDFLAGLGYSRAGDGVIDAWKYVDGNGVTVRIEASTQQDGQIDRWEHYRDGVLARVDLDTNGNGKRDRWETYANGQITATVIDRNEDGRPDPR